MENSERQEVIINIISGHKEIPRVGSADYNAAKGALHHLRERNNYGAFVTFVVFR